jgi:hypothetical protein
MPAHRRIAAVVWLGAFHKFARIHQAETEGNHGGPNHCDDAQPTVREGGEHLIDLRSVSEALTASCGNGIDVLFVRHQASMGAAGAPSQTCTGRGWRPDGPIARESRL